MPEPERARRAAATHSIATALGVAVFALALLPARPVCAQIRDTSHAQVEQELERLLTVAVQRYEDLRLDSAASALELAINEARDNNYSGRLLAEIHMWRGLVFFARKDEDHERHTRDAFVQALTSDRSVRLAPEVATPTLEAIFDTALQSLTNGQVCETVPTGARFDGHLKHTPRRRVDAGRSVTLEATVTPILRGRMETLHVFFRTPKMDSVRRMPMTPTDGDRFVATIPGKYVQGTVLTYYMLVDDREGSLIAQYQSAQAPAKIIIDDLATGQALGDDGGDTGADESEAAADKGRAATGQDVEPEPDDPSSLDGEGGQSRPGGRFSAAFALGTGIGRVTETSRPQTRKQARVAPGMAFAPLHTLLEIDYRIADRFSVGLLARVQLIDFTHLEGLRMRYEALRKGGHAVSLRGGLAYGHISHQVPLGPYRDFTLEGPFGYTLGVSYAHGLNKQWSFVVAPDFWHMMGDAPTQHFDLSLGAAARF